MTQPRERNTTRIVLIVIGVLAVLCCGVFVAAAFGFNVLLNTTRPAREAADEFLKRVQSGDTSSAYASLCAPTRGRFTEAAFDQTIHNRPFSSYSIVMTSVATVNGVPSASVSVKLRYADGSSDNHEVPLVKENDEWHVCGQPY